MILNNLKQLKLSMFFEYLGFGGVVLNTPLIKRTIRGCCPATCPSILGRAEDRADLFPSV